MQERGIPRHDYEIKNGDGDVIGIVTSGTMSPALGAGIGMGYIKSEYAGFGKEIFIQIRNKTLKAEIVKLPFYKS
jgi:aminomethyltransferase